MSAPAAAPAAAPAGAGGGSASRRNPELDATRGLALVLAIVVVTAPSVDLLPSWFAPSDFRGRSVADHLPAVFATIAGVAIAFQWKANQKRSWFWWLVRIARRGVVLVGVGLLLNWLASPAWPFELEDIRWTNDLIRIGVASVIAIPLTRLPRWGEVLIFTALLAFHTMVTLAGGTGLEPEFNGLVGYDRDLLSGQALYPVDPNGITALAPTVAAMLAGFWAGEWLSGRPRSAATGGVLMMIAAWAGLLVYYVDIIPAVATLWTAPIVVGGIAATLAALGVFHLGTRSRPTDRGVALLTPLGVNALPMYLLASVIGLSLSDTEAWTTAIEWLGAGIGTGLATIVIGTLVAGVLGRVSGLLVDRGWRIRA